MDKKEILKRVDHTQLKAYATWEDIVTLCDEQLQTGRLLSVYRRFILRGYMISIRRRSIFVPWWDSRWDIL